MPTVTNISAYRFASLQGLKPLRERLIALCRASHLKGTILLSTEGINLFVAGSNLAVDELLNELRNVPGLEDLQPKVSESQEQPFHRMLVKIKREIIAFGVEGIDPARHPSPKISPRELKQWLDEGRPVSLLDTRNDYEVELGTFENATKLDIDHFRHFPDAVRKLPAQWKQQPIVMFCTGGIRCEKAGPFMQREGFEKIFQLDGGILKYFEDCGGAHYKGECFVFDQRVGVDAGLHESETTQCFACQSPLSPEDRQDVRFVEGRSCPHCFVPVESLAASILKQRSEQLRQLTTPLPGSLPYENFRPLNVPARFDGQPVLDFLCGILGQVSRDEWRRVCDEGRLLRRTSNTNRRAINREGTEPIAFDDRVRAGDRYLHLESSTIEPDVNVDIQIVHEDEAIVVVNKPAPLPMHPCGRFHRNSLQYILSELYQPQSPRPAHRLDANTSGIVLFSRTRHFAGLLQRQFEQIGNDGIEKQYLARVHGHPVTNEFDCRLPISDEPGAFGSRTVDVAKGLPAVTEFRVLERFDDGTSLLNVVPLTGRTNQIRVHLWSLGFPICGDPMYLRGNEQGTAQTLSVQARPLCLLARRIAFWHPLTGERVAFEAPPLDWCRPISCQGSRSAEELRAE